MPDNLQDVNLSSNTFHIRLVFDLVFFKNLNGNLLSGNQMSSESHLSEGSLTE
jgi:hypothetical protein